MIIEGRQTKNKAIMELIITLLGWIFILATILQVFYALFLYFGQYSNTTELLIFGGVEKTVRTVFITFGSAALWFSILFHWSKYNFKKYGSLKRRNFPEDVSKEEIATYFGLPAEKIEELQAAKIITLDKTMV